MNWLINAFKSLLTLFYVVIPGHAPKPAVDYGVQFGPWQYTANDIDTLARTLWGEARSEGYQGMQAVANVCINRYRLRQAGAGYPSFGRVRASIAEICRAPWQFSCWNATDPNLPRLRTVKATDIHFRQALAIAERAAQGILPDITGGADHYHTTAVRPDWSAGKTAIKQIGTHKFFRLIGAGAMS